MSLDVVLLASIDPIVRDIASLGVVCDMDTGLEVRHELVTLPDGSQEVRCTVADATGLVYREDFSLDHGCLSCTVREGLVPTLRWIAEQQRWRQVLVTLPVSASREAVAWQLADAIECGDLTDVRLAHVLTVVDQTTLVDDLLGEDLLVERDLTLSDVDERAVGEALSSQLDYSDTVVTLDAPDAMVDSLLEHVLPVELARAGGIGALDVACLFASSHDVAANQERLVPSGRRPRRTADSDGVWTLDLVSDKPFHPGRLLSEIELLGSGPVRARGCFWLPSRPGVICVWDGSGGQLSIGEAGPWQGTRPVTRIVVSGVDDEVHDRIVRAFDDVLVTDAELGSALARWAGRPDGLEPWLGEVEQLDHAG